MRSGPAALASPTPGIFTVAGRMVAPGADEGFDDRFEVRLVVGDFVVSPVLVTPTGR